MIRFGNVMYNQENILRHFIHVELFFFKKKVKAKGQVSCNRSLGFRLTKEPPVWAHRSLRFRLTLKVQVLANRGLQFRLTERSRFRLTEKVQVEANIKGLGSG